ncbi:MAG: hypothetical protein DWH91_17500 [Planctomycetota bacterium]|nr:MAG: hypothetical protein DWH91_17500 [Planctomycetota bacterium]
MMTKVLTGKATSGGILAENSSRGLRGSKEVGEPAATTSFAPLLSPVGPEEPERESPAFNSASAPPPLNCESSALDALARMPTPRMPVPQSEQPFRESAPADLHTPYGATESLPVASIGAREVLSRTAEKTRQGAGTCVGRAFPGVNIRIIPVTDGPITSINDTQALPPGEIGEIVVHSPSVTREYFRRPEATAAAKIPDGDSFWHRIGDVGYLDEEGLLWFCGRKAHIVSPASGPLYSVCCEAIFEAAPWVYRAALVGVGTRGSQTPVMIIEPERPDSGRQLQVVGSVPQRITHHPRAGELPHLAATSPLTKCITRFLMIDSMPVDTRHNVKIHRESLAAWADKKLNAESPGPQSEP